MNKKYGFNSCFAKILCLLCMLLCLTACAQQETEHSIESVDDLSGAKIGVQIGTTGDIYSSDYEGDEAGTEVIRYNKGADAVQALKQGKLDCVLIDEQPAIAFTEKNTDLAILDEEFALEEYAMCIAKGNYELLNKVNEALDYLQQDGTIASIINNYIGDDTKGKTPYESPENVDRSNGTLTMATNVGFPPYEYYENGKATGIDVDMAQAIADYLGMNLVVSDMEFDSIIVAVQSGKADIGVAGMTVTEDRLKNIDFTNSYTTAKQVVIVRNGSTAQSQTLTQKFSQVFVEGNRWQYIPKGLLNTVLITLFSGLIGIFLGTQVADVRVAYERNESKGIGVRIGNAISKVYITVFRGTPMMVQLLIMYYVIFGSTKLSPLFVAIIAFGLNSGAYVAEAIRAGIMSVDFGQFEAGRSLGFTYSKTMRYIIMPQAIKNALPSMFNEFIALLKESSIVGYIGLMDLTKAGDIIRSSTYEALMPLVAVALVYLVIVMLMTTCVNRLERRLKRDVR